MCEIQERHDKRCGHLVQIHHEPCEDECGRWELFGNWHTTLVLCKKRECVERRKTISKIAKALKQREILDLTSSPGSPKIRDQEESGPDNQNVEEPKATETSTQQPQSRTLPDEEKKKRDFWSIIS